MLLLVLIAGLAMLIQDVLGVLLVQAEARNRGWLSGGLDSLAWLCGIFTTTVSVTTLQGHDMARKIAVVAAVTVANVGGSVLGVAIGRRLVKEAPDEEAR